MERQLYLMLLNKLASILQCHPKMVTKLGEFTLHGVLWVYYGEIHISSIKAPHFGFKFNNSILCL